MELPIQTSLALSFRNDDLPLIQRAQNLRPPLTHTAKNFRILPRLTALRYHKFVAKMCFISQISLSPLSELHHLATTLPPITTP